MLKVLEIAGIAIASLGGGGIIVFALSGWLGKLWANRLLENEKAKHQKEIENYKNELRSKLDKLNAINEKELFISKLQYEKEFEIYLEIWESLHENVLYTLSMLPRLDSLPPEKENRLETYRTRYKNFSEKYNKFSRTIEKFSPFYKEDFYNKFIQIRKLSHEYSTIFDMYYLNNEFDEPLDKKNHKRIYIELPDEIENLAKELGKEIRRYLLKIQLK